MGVRVPAGEREFGAVTRDDLAADPDRAKQTTGEPLLCAVWWYLRYSLSLRDVEELLEERGLNVDAIICLRLKVATLPLSPKCISPNNGASSDS
jgi:hypothetical protein